MDIQRRVRSIRSILTLFFSDVIDSNSHNGRGGLGAEMWTFGQNSYGELVHGDMARYVCIVVHVVHVGGTRCVTSSTDPYMKIHGCVTLSVECIRPCIFVFLFDV